MPKYYCEYCRSYLTHDSKSVRKSHLVGKNHLRFYCDYYMKQAKSLNLWQEDTEGVAYSITTRHIYKGIPSTTTGTTTATANIPHDNENNDHSTANVLDSEERSNLLIKHQFLPPPPTTSTSLNLPNPPPSIYHYNQKEHRNKILQFIKDLEIEENEANEGLSNNTSEIDALR